MQKQNRISQSAIVFFIFGFMFAFFESNGMQLLKIVRNHRQKLNKVYKKKNKRTYHDKDNSFFYSKNRKNIPAYLVWLTLGIAAGEFSLDKAKKIKKKLYEENFFETEVGQEVVKVIARQIQPVLIEKILEKETKIAHDITHTLNKASLRYIITSNVPEYLSPMLFIPKKTTSSLIDILVSGKQSRTANNFALPFTHYTLCKAQSQLVSEKYIKLFLEWAFYGDMVDVPESIKETFTPEYERSKELFSNTMNITETLGAYYMSRQLAMTTLKIGALRTVALCLPCVTIPVAIVFEYFSDPVKGLERQKKLLNHIEDSKGMMKRTGKFILNLIKFSDDDILWNQDKKTKFAMICEPIKHEGQDIIDSGVKKIQESTEDIVYAVDNRPTKAIKPIKGIVKNKSLD